MFFSNEAQHVNNNVSYESLVRRKRRLFMILCLAAQISGAFNHKFMNNEDIVTNKSITFHPDETHMPLVFYRTTFLFLKLYL